MANKIGDFASVLKFFAHNSNIAAKI